MQEELQLNLLYCNLNISNIDPPPKLSINLNTFRRKHKQGETTAVIIS